MSENETKYIANQECDEYASCLDTDTDTGIVTEQKLRARIERQKVLISIALGYINSGKPEIAALLLAVFGDEDSEKEPT